MWSKILKHEMKLIVICTILLLQWDARCAFIMDIANNFSIDEGDVESLEFSKMSFRGFLGASLDSDGQFYFGQNISSFSHEFTTSSGTSELSILELGPRFQFYFSSDKTVFITAAWNPFLKGDRKTLSGSDESVSGSSYLAALGYQMKVSKSFHLGATINYHSINISKVTDSSNLESSVSQGYSSIYPMIEISLRFK